MSTYGPVELRIRWIEDETLPDPGDCDDAEFWKYVERFGVYGCVVETRKPVCACCGLNEWEHATSLWSIIGGADYHREIERELTREAVA